MIFSPNSAVTLVVTSCGRFDLLARTLKSFDRFNTAAIRSVFITEDSGSQAVHNCLPPGWEDHSRIWVNNPALGQLKSIDTAYACVETPFIFHCEDDWEFYRPGFIEDSLVLLEHDPQALQVWLRSLTHDLAVHSPYVYVRDRQLFQGVPYYRLFSSKPEWQGFSFNPGLRRMDDYLLFAPYAERGGEKRLSVEYAEAQRYALILENDAVLHTGWESHVSTQNEGDKKRRRKTMEKLRLAGALIVGLLLGLML